MNHTTSRKNLAYLGADRRLAAVKIGRFTVYASSGLRLESEDFKPGHLQVPLTRYFDLPDSGNFEVHPVFMQDLGGVPIDWQDRVKAVLGRIMRGASAHIFCDGGKGRTGTMLASLVALAESHRSTPDPIAAVRERYFHGAVETIEQAEAIFALRGQPVPEKYVMQLLPPLWHLRHQAALQQLQLSGPALGKLPNLNGWPPIASHRIATGPGANPLRPMTRYEQAGLDGLNALATLADASKTLYRVASAVAALAAKSVQKRRANQTS